MDRSNEGLKILIYSFLIFAIVAALACYMQDFLEAHEFIGRRTWHAYI